MGQGFYASKKGSLVQTQLNIGLKRAAHTKYIAELNNLECQAFSNDCGNKAEHYIDALKKHFKEQPGIVLSKLINEKYTVQNAYNRRKPAE